ncbi:hypothetical protein RRG08_007677 [Elysia crispata]|uniref:Uncharacterized protein n=1 Tax=Elysia crispata TaxID=231223 RepID=A0AAE0Y393_9GAST|nr:hypothetical protein RRG08_007677 [Elysia crispata]
MPQPHEESLAEGDEASACPIPACKKLSLLWSSFDARVHKKEQGASHRRTAAKMEIRRHLEIPCIPRDSNPLDWCRDYNMATPRITHIAKDVLGSQ